MSVPFSKSQAGPSPPHSRLSMPACWGDYLYEVGPIEIIFLAQAAGSLSRD